MRPLRGAQVEGTNECERLETQGAARDKVALISTDGSQEFRDALRIGDACEMIPLDWRQRSTQIGGGIALGTGRGDGVAEDLAAIAQTPVRGIKRTARLSTADCSQ